MLPPNYGYVYNMPHREVREVSTLDIANSDKVQIFLNPPVTYKDSCGICTFLQILAFWAPTAPHARPPGYEFVWDRHLFHSM